MYFVTLVVWFATGIWHGASWNFIVWGLLNAVVILLSQECRPLYEKFHAHFPGIQKNMPTVFSGGAHGAFDVLTAYAGLLPECRADF